MKSKFKIEQEKEYAINSKDISRVKELTEQLSKLQQRMNCDFPVEQNAITEQIEKENVNIGHVNEIWLINVFNKG